MRAIFIMALPISGLLLTSQIYAHDCSGGGAIFLATCDNMDNLIIDVIGPQGDETRRDIWLPSRCEQIEEKLRMSVPSSLSQTRVVAVCDNQDHLLKMVILPSGQVRDMPKVWLPNNCQAEADAINFR